ncbi:MAG: heavy-metal-associated domain-containing protein [Acidimicrobiia bacterium]
MIAPTTLPVEGMTCTGCENKIQFALASLEGVGRVHDHEAKTVEVDYDPALITVDEIRRAVEDVGYRVVGS